MGKKIIFLVGALLLVGGCLAAMALPPLSAALIGESSKNAMESFAEQSFVAGQDGPGETITMTERALWMILKHDEVMVDKLVAVAVSGDTAQTVASTAQAGSTTVSVIIFAALILAVLVIVLGRK